MVWLLRAALGFLALARAHAASLPLGLHKVSGTSALGKWSSDGGGGAFSAIVMVYNSTAPSNRIGVQLTKCHIWGCNAGTAFFTDTSSPPTPAARSSPTTSVVSGTLGSGPFAKCFLTILAVIGSIWWRSVAVRPWALALLCVLLSMTLAVGVVVGAAEFTTTNCSDTRRYFGSTGACGTAVSLQADGKFTVTVDSWYNYVVSGTISGQVDELGTYVYHATYGLLPPFYRNVGSEYKTESGQQFSTLRDSWTVVAIHHVRSSLGDRVAGEAYDENGNLRTMWNDVPVQACLDLLGKDSVVVVASTEAAGTKIQVTPMTGGCNVENMKPTGGDVYYACPDGTPRPLCQDTSGFGMPVNGAVVDMRVRVRTFLVLLVSAVVAQRV